MMRPFAPFGLFVLSLVLSASASAAPARIEPMPLPKGDEYFHLRQGLENSQARFTRGGPARVAFLGGSITAMSGWREQVMAYLRRRFPQAEFDFVSAGIGSLGSVPHAFRLSRDVLSRGPVDLLFVEAAVNDTSNIPEQPERMLRGMEGIVRHARTENPAIDIVHLHFVMPPHMDDYRGGRDPLAIRQHEKVAQAYGNASLNLAREVTDRIDAGQFTWEGDFKNLHPSPFGHALYARSIARLLDRAWPESARPEVKPHSLPASPLDPFSYVRGRFGAISGVRIVRGFTIERAWRPTDGKMTREGFVAVPALVGIAPGAEFEFEMQGTAAGLFIAAGPDAGIVEYSVDGGAFAAVDSYTPWSSSLHLPWALILDDMMPEGRHTIRVRISDRRNPRSTGHALRVFQLLLN